MSTIAQNIAQIRTSIPKNVDLVCVSKFHSQNDILQAYDAGERFFGESRTQELLQKYNALPKDICWHFIGHLQRNKVRQIIPFVDLIHSVDSLDLLKEINHCAEKIGRKVAILLQVHIAQEEQKFGFLPAELLQVFSVFDSKEFPFISIRGLMGMATFTTNEEQIMSEFLLLSKLFSELKQKYFFLDDSFSILSMGMSEDFYLAVKAGSTMVRVGSSIFGERI